MANDNTGIVALMVAAGAAMALIGSGKLFRSAGAGGLPPAPPVTPPAGSETMSDPFIPQLEPASVVLDVPLGGYLVLPLPLVKYTGPGRDAFTYARIVQNGQTVYGSGIAGVHIGGGVPQVGGADTYPLVAFEQPEPFGWQPQSLGLYPYPGPPPTHFPGVQARVGMADLWLEIYQRDSTSTDGLASPLENNRVAVKRRVYPGKVRFTGV